MTNDVYWIKKGGVAGRLLQVSLVNIVFLRKCAQPEHSTSLQPRAEAGLQTAGHLTPGDDDDFISRGGLIEKGQNPDSGSKNSENQNNDAVS